MTALVVMGPSGCGKTTLGRALAEAMQLAYVDGDDLHPPRNVDKMRAGEPLTDADRAPFLDNVARAIRDAGARGIVVSCSALKRAYRDHLRIGAGREIWYVYPRLSRERLLERVRGRSDHFMPASLLDSQLAALEEPTRDERAIVVAGEPIATQVAHVMRALGRDGPNA